jgi:opine dehydrogenase
MEVKRFAVVGAGNAGCAIAADMTLAGFEVRLFEFPEFKERFQKILDEQAIRLIGEGTQCLAKVFATTDLKEAVKDVQLILVSIPSFGHGRLAEELIPVIEDGQVVIFMPGGFGSYLFLKNLTRVRPERKIVVGETSTLPYAARLSGPNEVSIYIRAILNPAATIPTGKTESVVKDLRKLYPEITSARDVLDVALNNLNPSTHVAPSILSASRVEMADEFWLYREGMTPSVQKVMVALDNERIAVREGLGYGPPHYDLKKSGAQECFEDYFGKGGKEKAGYHLKGPLNMKERYITEDIAYGLVFFASWGDKLGIDTPMMDAFIRIASVMNDTDYMNEGFTINRLGFQDLSLEVIIKSIREGF